MSAQSIGDSPPRALLLYDGTCGFCARSVQFVLRHEGPRNTLRFASLEGPTGLEIRRSHPALATVDSLIWYEAPANGHPERLLVRSTAALTVARYLGGIWRVLGALGRLVPRPMRDAVYDTIARNRRSLSGADSCLLPTPAQRPRFIDFA